jgi:hypothetical protein
MSFLARQIRLSFLERAALDTPLRSLIRY